MTRNLLLATALFLVASLASATTPPYLDPELTLRTLAAQIDLSERKLSTILNEGLGTSFYDYVNAYRVQEAKARLTADDAANYSISGIGELCGFNSKSTFFRIFKKATGLSPGAYVEEQKK